MGEPDTKAKRKVCDKNLFSENIESGSNRLLKMIPADVKAAWCKGTRNKRTGN